MFLKQVRTGGVIAFAAFVAVVSAAQRQVHSAALIDQTSSMTAADKLLDEGKLDEAKAAYSVLIKSGPKNLGPRVGLLRTLLGMDNILEGMAATKAAESALPGNADLKGMESLFLMRDGQPEEAIKAADDAIKASKDSYWALIAQGRGLAWQYKKDEARTAMNRAISLKPNYLEGYHFLIQTFGLTDEVQRLKIEDQAHAISEKIHPRKAPKDKDEADKRKAQDAKEKTEFDKSLKYAELFEKSPAFAPLSPVSDTKFGSADSGDASPISFTFPIERGNGENGKDDIIIPVSVDGVKLHMLLDTGAGYKFSIDKYSASRLNLPDLAKSAAMGVNGVEPTRLHKAERATIGKQVFANIPVESVDTRIGDEDGLIGGGIFEKYVVTIDNRENTMTLARGRDAVAPAPLKGDKCVQVPFHFENGYIFVKISVDNHKWWTILDTGAQGFGVISLDLARQLAKERDKTSTAALDVKGRMGIGISETSFRVLVFEFPVDVGCLVGDRTPYFIQMDDLYGSSLIDKVSQAYDYKLAGLLGIGYLCQRCKRFSIDYPHRVLTMEQPDE